MGRETGAGSARPRFVLDTLSTLQRSELILLEQLEHALRHLVGLSQHGLRSLD